MLNASTKHESWQILTSVATPTSPSSQGVVTLKHESFAEAVKCVLTKKQPNSYFRNKNEKNVELGTSPVRATNSSYHSKFTPGNISLNKLNPDNQNSKQVKFFHQNAQMATNQGEEVSLMCEERRAQPQSISCYLTWFQQP